LLLGILWVRGGFPTGFMMFVGVIMALMIIYRQAKRDVERDEREARDVRYQAKRPPAREAPKPKVESDDSTEEPEQSTPLKTINEEADEHIEEINCPGIDGQRRGGPPQGFRNV
jgi:flagellar biosynthesis/type III secretory pathway M-ring protein FliF/YscJ